MEHINPNDIAINARRRRQSSSNTEISNEVSNVSYVLQVRKHCIVNFMVELCKYVLIGCNMAARGLTDIYACLRESADISVKP